MRRFDFDSTGAPGAGPGRAAELAAMAVAALRDELDLTPKPGLVDRASTGAHLDMDHALMTASANALEPGFAAIATAAARESGPVNRRAAIGAAGREAERAMMTVTGGINTHRGAIWALGLIVSAAATRERCEWLATELLAGVAALAAIDDPASRDVAAPSNGQRAIARYCVAGARGEAIAGFPQIVTAALPTLRRARGRGMDETAARLDALAAIIAVLDDTCVLHRAGAAGLVAIQRRAAAVAVAGGAATEAGQRALAVLDTALIARNASPGGAADLLAATLFIDRLEAAASAGGHFIQEINHANAIA